MCYSLGLSTDSPLDLSTLNSLTAFFVQDFSDEDKATLKYEYKYRLATGAPNCCSCYFRIFSYDEAQEFDFEQLQEWREEEAKDDDVLNTEWLLQIIKDLVVKGFHVDTYVSDWDTFKLSFENAETINVSDYDNDNFAFIECVYYDYK